LRAVGNCSRRISGEAKAAPYPRIENTNSTTNVIDPGLGHGAAFVALSTTARVGDALLSLSQAADGASGSETVYCLHTRTSREVDEMKVSNRLGTVGALVLASLILCLSGCIVHDREVVHHDRDHDGAYAQGYEEGYYDREHHRWWHDKAWRDCVEDDIHCPH